MAAQNRLIHETGARYIDFVIPGLLGMNLMGSGIWGLVFAIVEARQKKLDEWLGNLVSNFGDDEGNEVSFNGTVVQALMMMNGQDINDAINRKDGTVALVMARNRVPANLINDVYLIALNRLPTPLERKTLLERLPLRAQFRASIPSSLTDSSTRPPWCGTG